MLRHTPKIKELYEEIQRKIFYVVPTKWEELYLYASIIDRLGNVQTGEMYFYFLPKGLLKRKFINVYEVPNKYNIEEDEYLDLIKILYETIKQLREEFRNSGQKVWSNITISIKKNKFKIEFNYDNLLNSEYSSYENHILWRYKYLNIEPHKKEEKEILKRHLLFDTNTKNEEYITGLYKKQEQNIVTYETRGFESTQKVQYLASKTEKTAKNQILYINNGRSN